jgi:hypothetical protein
MPKAKSSCEIVNNYFNNDNPDAKDGVMRATFAYHFKHLREHPKAHKFSGPWRDCRCEWCDISREEVRWCEDLPYECQKRPSSIKDDVVEEIEEVLLKEENLYTSLLQRGEKFIPKFVNKHGLTGETLSILFHTHGYSPEVVETYFDIPKEILQEFDNMMEKESSRSLQDTLAKRKDIKVQYDNSSQSKQ